MTQKQSNQLQHVQRIQVGLEGQAPAKRLKISVENYDDGLGWYQAGSLSIPAHQLPLLEQALAELRDQPVADPGSGATKVIPFPGLRAAQG